MADSVLITRQPLGRALDMLMKAGSIDLWEENTPMPRSELLARVAEADGLYCMLNDGIDSELLAAAPRLRVISTMAVGVDNIDLVACTKRGVAVGHTPGVLTEATADLAMALLLAAARRLKEGIDHVGSGLWGEFQPDLLLGQDVHSSTVGIVGLGRIGSAVARRVAGFGTSILYAGPTAKPALEEELGAERRDLSGLLSEADHVVLTAPLNPDTHHLIDARALRLMKPTATLVNVARGPLVDTAALYGALRNGDIGAAGLDVTDPEPLPSDHPLLALPNCIVIPHLGSASLRTRTEMAEMAARNLVLGLNGAPMEACANPAVYL
jgi:lactate dehydrogenase-like 2-hydroxyacid dehydrogenase